MVHLIYRGKYCCDVDSEYIRTGAFDPDQVTCKVCLGNEVARLVQEEQRIKSQISQVSQRLTAILVQGGEK